MRQVLTEIIALSQEDEVQIISCESGEDAVVQYPLFRPDVVLMDIELQGMNGLEAARIICKEDSTARVIVVTSHNSPSMRKKAEKLSLLGFVSKDQLFDLNPILQTINHS